MNKSRNAIFREFIASVVNKAPDTSSPLDICLQYLADTSLLPEFISSSSEEEKFYWVGNVFTSLISTDRKKELAAFFTPPGIAQYVVSRALEFGLDLTAARILDPASGGAAFLVPLCAAIITEMKARGCSEAAIAEAICQNLHGIEIDDGLAGLSKAFLEKLITSELPGIENRQIPTIRNLDSLEAEAQNNSFDAVISNPPYGRILRPPKPLLDRFSKIITDGHVNKYALFAKLALDWVKPGGLIALLVPTSFIAGPLFGHLRQSILQDATVLCVDLIHEREDLFVGVLQDTCVLFLRKKREGDLQHRPTSRLIHEDGTFDEIGVVDLPPSPSTRPWVLPSESATDIPPEDFFSSSYAKLADYGYGARTGYFVWNREKHRSREGDTPTEGEFPLIWAHCVRPNERCTLSTHKLNGTPGLTSFVQMEPSSTPLIRKPAIILQRTTNRKQKSRLIAGYIDEELLNEFKAVVSENHTIVIHPLEDAAQRVPLSLMCRLLNSSPVDSRYRQVAVTVNVSVKLLKEIPLPPPSLLPAELHEAVTDGDFDALVEETYQLARVTA